MAWFLTLRGRLPYTGAGLVTLRRPQWCAWRFLMLPCNREVRRNARAGAQTVGFLVAHGYCQQATGDGEVRVLITTFAIWCGPETRFNDIRADTPEDLVADGPVAKHV